MPPPDYPNSEAFARTRARTFRGVSGYARNLEQTRPSFQNEAPGWSGRFSGIASGLLPNCARGSGCASNQAYRFDVAPVRRRSSGVTVSVGAPLQGPQVTRVTLQQINLSRRR